MRDRSAAIVAGSDVCDGDNNVKPGDRIVTLLGRKGVLKAVERVWLTVVFDDQPDWPQCFHAFDKWIQSEVARG